MFLCGTSAYFTRPGKCPENVKLQEEFRLADFFDKWYQTYHYSSDGRSRNNCSTIELSTGKDGIYWNQTRVDRGLFQRFSIAKLAIPIEVDNAADLIVVFINPEAPRRLVTRQYAFKVLATNYKYYATVYTCQYSPLIDKHFIYVWILSRNPILNDVSKELALKPLKQLGINSGDLVKDDLSPEKCTPKYYEDEKVEPFTFNIAVPIK